MHAAASTTTTHSVRQADPHEHAPLAEMLTRAFDDDPIARWACPIDSLRPQAMHRFHEIFLELAQRQGWVWTSGDHEAAALWFAPDASRVAFRDALRIAAAFAHPRIAWRLPVVAGGSIYVDARQPHMPEHFYFALLGADPDSQGKGHGSALMRQTLAICDEEGVPARLETGKARNVPLYERHGFRVTRKIRLPFGPEVFLMWRDPLGMDDRSLDQYKFDDYESPGEHDGSQRLGAPRVRRPQRPGS